jgi:hypothetical protein
LPLQLCVFEHDVWKLLKLLCLLYLVWNIHQPDSVKIQQ